MEETKGALVLPMSIASLLEARAAIIQSWKDAGEALTNIDKAFARINDKDFRFRFRTQDRYDETDFTKRYPLMLKEQVEALDNSLWLFAVEKLNLTKAMTGKAADEFLARMEKEKAPFCEVQILGLIQNAEKIFRDSSLNTVREVFRQLIGAEYRSGNDWRIEKKRDNLQKVERVFRVGWSDLRISWSGRGLSTDSMRATNGAFHFNDLLTACRLIEGQGFTDYSNNVDAHCRAGGDSLVVDCGYFRAQAYKNGNVKVNWNDDAIDVLDRLNAIGSGRENSMPDTMRKRYKPEHFHDGGMAKAETYFQPKESDVPNMDRDFDFYPTPDHVAIQMVGLADYPENPSHENGTYLDTLEPSAGEGAILKYIPWDFGCRAIEFNTYRSQTLKESFPAWVVEEVDFLKWNSDMRYDRVIMNPPFNDRVEAVHLVRAFSFLKPGGILVSILPEGWFIRSDSKSVILREFLTRNEYKPAVELESHTFKRTGIKTRIVVLQKPKEAT